MSHRADLAEDDRAAALLIAAVCTVARRDALAGSVEAARWLAEVEGAGRDAAERAGVRLAEPAERPAPIWPAGRPLRAGNGRRRAA